MLAYNANTLQPFEPYLFTYFSHGHPHTLVRRIVVLTYPEQIIVIELKIISSVAHTIIFS